MDENKTEEQPKEAPKKVESSANSSNKEEENKSNPLLLTLVLFNTIFVGYLLYQQSQLTSEADKLIAKKTAIIPEQKDGQNQFDIKPKDGFIIQEFPMQTVTANLARPDGAQRFITLTMVFILETPQDKPTDELTNKIPTFRDEIIDILNTHTPAQVLKLEGREVLKNLLKGHLNRELKNDKVRRILFTQFKVS